MTTEKDSLYNAVLLGDKKSVLTILKNRVASGVSVIDLIDRVMIPAVKEVGEKFSKNEIYVSEMLLSARALQAGLNFLKPFMGDERKRKAGLKIAVGTVKGDLHEIGKDLVITMLRMNGFEVFDLGVNCDIDTFRKAVNMGARILMCSALMTTTMIFMQKIVEEFRNYEEIKIVVGGAPVTREFAREINADDYGETAIDAVKIASKYETSG